ncbi:MAG: UbiD family decarboxylase [Armatimonadetes bacterium]|nr:UbiD family decarboxylase [Armatimonadota bacterium]
MSVSLRDHLDVLARHGDLLTVDAPVDLRYVSAVIARSPRAVLFNRLADYDLRAVGGVLSTRDRLAWAFGMPYPEICHRVQKGMDAPVEPALVADAPVRQVVRRGEEVDLTVLPIIVFNETDGGPFISSGVTVARDPELGFNAGFYRMMLRNRQTLSIAPGYRTSLAEFYRRAMARGEPLEVSVSIGTHPIDSMAAATFLPLGRSELHLAGGMRGRPLELSPGVTVGVPALAHAEIVIEGVMPPVGWTVQEGKFPEFHGYVTGVLHNPILEVRAVTHRRDAMLHSLQMPMEDLWITGPPLEANAWQALRRAGITARAVYATPGGCCAFHVVAAIEGPPGAGRRALESLLEVGIVKHAIVTDADIDVYESEQVEWAIATRFQADRDLVVLTRRPGKGIDPSIMIWEEGRPLTAKIGLDATLGADVPRSRYERIVYPYHHDPVVETILRDGPVPVPVDAATQEGAGVRVEAQLRGGSRYFVEVLRALPDVPYRAVAATVARLDEEGRLDRDGEGRLRMRGTPEEVLRS